MAELQLSEAAERDLLDIFASGAAQFGRPFAEAYRDSLKRSLTLLAAHPSSARARPDLGKGRARPPTSISYDFTCNGAVQLVAQVPPAAMDAIGYLTALRRII